MALDANWPVATRDYVDRVYARLLRMDDEIKDTILIKAVTDVQNGVASLTGAIGVTKSEEEGDDENLTVTVSGVLSLVNGEDKIDDVAGALRTLSTGLSGKADAFTIEEDSVLSLSRKAAESGVDGEGDLVLSCDVTETVEKDSKSLVTSGAVYDAVGEGLTKATKDAAGVVRVGDGLDVNDGTVSVGDGVVTQLKVGNAELTTVPRTETGKFGGTVTIPVATDSAAGVVRVGDGLEVDEKGTLGVSDDVITQVKVGGEAVSSASRPDKFGGVVDIPKATTSVAGVVKVGDSLMVDAMGALGVSGDVITQVKVGGSPVASTSGTDEGRFGGTVNIPVATTGVAGVITVGDGLVVTDGKAGVSVTKDGGLTVDSLGLRVDTDTVATVEYVTRVIGGVADALAEVLGEETT